jgi:hypothetical protein
VTDTDPFPCIFLQECSWLLHGLVSIIIARKNGNDRKNLIRFFHEIPSIPAGGGSLYIKGAFFIPATGHHGSASLMPGTG